MCVRIVCTLILMQIKSVYTGGTTPPPCNTVLQECQNTYAANTGSICSKTHLGETKADCLDRLYGTDTNMVSFNPDYHGDTRCFEDISCPWSTFQLSNYNSTSYRIGCEQACNSVIVTPYDDRAVHEFYQPDVILQGSSLSKCTTHCVENAFNGTTCTAVHSPLYGTCKVYTSPTHQVYPHILKNGKKLLIARCNKSCSELTDPVNGFVIHTGLHIGSRATYMCHSGYVPTSDQPRICQLDTLWNADPISCERIDCGLPLSIANGTVHMNGTRYLDTIDYECVAGYNINGSDTFICQADGTWSGVPACVSLDCGNPPTIENGNIYINSTTCNSTIEYMCFVGYILAGPITRRCLPSGSWTGLDPECNIVDCGAPPSIPHCTAHVNATTYQQTVNYTCGHPGLITKTCEEDGQWSALTSCCDTAPTDCGPPDGIANGTVIYNSTHEGSVANYDCYTRCEMDGHNQSTCLSTGSWSHPAPLCLCKLCEDLSPPVNGSVLTTDGSYIGSAANYACSAGFRLTGTNNRTCTVTGWTSTVPTCNAPGTHKWPRYIMPCRCHTTSAFGNMTQQEIVDQLVKDTIIDAKNTAKAQQKLECLVDSRGSSKLIGTLGISIISIVFGLIVLLDCLSLLCNNCRNTNFRSFPKHRGETTE